MKNFRQYRYFEYTQEDYKEIWETATFVFDTSALLNLYKYRKETRKEFFEALEKIEDRLWIPHHIALEFNKNRLEVISNEIKNFTTTISALSSLETEFVSKINKLSLKKTHKIDTENITKTIRELTQKINQDLKTQLEKEIKLKGSDPIRDEIFKLFEGKVGEKPQDQATINNWENEAKERHKLKIAPGFGDKDKDEICIDNGLTYQKKYSDFIIWKQILAQSKKISIKNLIFITSDSQKSDWFLTTSANEVKAIQPKPELLDDAFHIGGLNNFLMYDTESFIKFAKEFLSLDISDNIIDEIGEISKNSRKQSIVSPFITKHSNGMKWYDIRKNIIHNKLRYNKIKTKVNPGHLYYTAEMCDKCNVLSIDGLNTIQMGEKKYKLCFNCVKELSDND